MTQHISLAELIGALSHALDVTEGQPKGHSQRCCWIGMHVGQSIGLSNEELSDLYYTLLLKDLGCSSNAARVCELYLTDDRAFKRDAKTMQDSLPQILRFIARNTGPNMPVVKRLRAIMNILKNGGDITQELFEARCFRGADIAKQMRFSPAVCDGIARLDEHWDGSGKPDRMIGRAIPMASQIALLSQVVDVFNQTEGRAAAVREITHRSGTWFDPSLVEVFEALSDDDAFWNSLTASDLPQAVLALEPGDIRRMADEDYLDDIAQAFAKVVDAKSPFTAGHSERVAIFADIIADQLGYDAAKRRWLRRAALLHDIGKLAISNTILDKPDKLTDEEFATIKTHPSHSAEILRGVAAFADIVAVAEGHHERLDGRGYPNRLQADAIDLDTRIVTVADVFDALTADRPYRKAMPAKDAFAILDKDQGTAFDASCIAALKAALVQLQLPDAA
jgi:putative nucleotidyltransferase with HDIG domain